MSTQFTAVIPINTALSGVLQINDLTPTAIVMPAAWDAANITIQTSQDGTNFNNLYDTTAEVALTSAAASRTLTLDGTKLRRGHRYLKIRSGTSATPVNQTAARTLTLICE